MKMKGNRFFKTIFFIVLIIPTIATINGLAWDWDPGGGGGDTTPPILSFVSPASGATVSRTVTITVTATDSGSGMDFVDFYIDSSYLGRDYTASNNQYSKSFNSWNYIYGGHTLKAAAFDNEGNVAVKFRSITIDNDPTKLDYPDEGTTWHTDAARHPEHATIYSIARKVAGYGMRKLSLSGSTRSNIIKGLAKFADDWLEELWSGADADDALTDLEVAAHFSAFDSSMDYGDLNFVRDFDCRDISAFISGMAMAMGIKAKMLSCEYHTGKHVAALLDDGTDDWFLISVFSDYVDSNSPLSDIQRHLSGGEPDIDTQYVFHFIYYLDNWSMGNSDLDEVGWIGWFIFDNCTVNDRYQAPEFYLDENPGRDDFIYWSSNPWEIECQYDDDYEVAEDLGWI